MYPAMGGKSHAGTHPRIDCRLKDQFARAGHDYRARLVATLPEQLVGAAPDLAILDHARQRLVRRQGAAQSFRCRSTAPNQIALVLLQARSRAAAIMCAGNDGKVSVCLKGESRGFGWLGRQDSQPRSVLTLLFTTINL
jgi:hypothetical protein